MHKRSVLLSGWLAILLALSQGLFALAGSTELRVWFLVGAGVALLIGVGLLIAYARDEEEVARVAIRLGEGEGLTLTNNKFFGFDSALTAKKIKGLKAEGNVMRKDTPDKKD